jgi:hypothetical protein
VSQARRSDLVGCGVAALVEGSIPFAILRFGHISWPRALVAGAAGAFSMLCAGGIWIRAGGPAADRMLRTHPLSTILATAVLMVGLIPAAVFAQR